MRRTILTVALGLVVFSAGRVDAHPPWGIAVDGRGRVVLRRHRPRQPYLAASKPRAS